jgi:iron(III) transport system permease protein
MSRVLLALLLAGIATPLLLPLAELIRHPSGFAALLEAPRILALAANTLALAAGAVAVAVPFGAAAAVLVGRSRVPGRGLLGGLVLLGALVPLPVYAAGWQAVFGAVALPDAGGWRPWREGLLPAIWVHGVAGIPWVAGFVALGLRTADPRLEDDARLAGGTRAVVRAVLWPRVRVFGLAGACWVAVQALTETAVTDVMMVRTFAEEVYFQMVGNPAGVAAAVAVNLPVWVLSAAFALFSLSRWFRGGSATVAGPRRDSPAGPAVSFAVWLGVLVLAGVPVAGLAARTGSVDQLLRVARAHGFTLADSLLWAALAGVLAAGIALEASWFARGSRRWAAFLLALAAVAWVMPAPLVGLGLKTAIGQLVALEDACLGPDAAFAPVRSLLYDQPSPLPAVWACTVRFFPVAVAVLWPAVRGVPRELLDAAALDGGRRAAWRVAAWPCVRGAFGRAAVAVAILSLGDVVASKLVQPPGRQSFAQELFNAMHYGADSTVAAMCLLQLAVTAALCGGLVLASGGRQPPKG